MKLILLLDFDGVCHLYTSGWQGPTTISDGPVPGLFEFLHRAMQVFDVQIYSARSKEPGGPEAMSAWFATHHAIWMGEDCPACGGTATHPDVGLIGNCPSCYGTGKIRSSASLGLIPSKLSYPQQKPSAFLTIDDRAICFSGVWPKVEDLQTFKPWNKRT